MPKKRNTDRNRKIYGDPRREAERRREEHTRTVFEREGDPRYVQSRSTSTGRTITWDPNSDNGATISSALKQQREHFIEKFGREPNPDDPLFFDPNANEPRPMQDFDWDAIFAAMDKAGIDRAYGKAWQELGYLVTDANRHTFSAMEAEAFLEAVERHMEDD
jgi:hypothetical protein